MLTICKEALNDVTPLSPPSLTHISVGGISPLCHVKATPIRFIVSPFPPACNSNIAIINSYSCHMFTTKEVKERVVKERVV